VLDKTSSPDSLLTNRKEPHVRRIHSILAVTAAAAVALAMAGSAYGLAPRDASSAGTGKNIVQTAKAAGQFKTLTALLKRAGLAKTLAGKGRFTVFAPTDRAFAKVPQKTLNALAKDKAQLRSVLLYHVAKGKLTAAKVVKRTSIKTLNGERVRVRVRHGKVFVGGARVTTPDVRASNGVIHVINRVLIPR
jgi:uncharacterized surface protein with fasciclin (FAS1) repeats